MAEETTPLADKLRRRIVREGPISVAAYMESCLADPEYGYYRTRDPLGARGDFTTAPEISQIFGELVGLWCAEVWRGMGTPDPFRLIELGPGRGTLMADALRAARVVPEFGAAARLQLVETSPVLRAQQKERLGAFAPAWHDAIERVPAGPAIVIANEFLDALPVRQFVRHDDDWRERCIDCGADGDFTYCERATDDAHSGLIPEAISQVAGEGDIVEVRPAADTIIDCLAERARNAPLAALFIDYGHAESAPGDTFQAVAAHGFADPLESPGHHDLTAHVDFAALARGATRAGLDTYGPMEQGRFLLELGLAQRREVLVKGATPEQARAIESGANRLIDPAQMGSLFKTMALCNGQAPEPPPFAGAHRQTRSGTEQ